MASTPPLGITELTYRDLVLVGAQHAYLRSGRHCRQAPPRATWRPKLFAHSGQTLVPSVSAARRMASAARARELSISASGRTSMSLFAKLGESSKNSLRLSAESALTIPTPPPVTKP